MTKLEIGIPAPQLKQEANAPTGVWMGLLGLWAESGIGGSGEAWPTVQKDLLAGMASAMGDCPVPNLQNEVANIHNADGLTTEK